MLDPSTFILSNAWREKKLLHDLSTVFLEHAGRHFDSMIQKICIANSKARLNGAGSFVAGAVDESLHSRLYQSARTHCAWLNGRIHDRVSKPIVPKLTGGFS